MGGRASSRKSGSMYDLVVGRDSYIYNSEYQSAMSEARQYAEERGTLQSRIRELEDQLDKEVEVDPELGRQYSKLLGLYTDKGKELDAQIKELRKQQEEVESRWTAATDYIAKEDARNRELQLNDWNSNQPDIVMATKSNYTGFELDTHTPYLQEYLSKGQALIVEMSPREYLQRVSYDIFGRSTLESTVRGTIPDNVRKYAQMMRNGTKFYMPSLNYNDKQQEGRHRALAALINGYKTIPVLIVPNRRRY